MNGRFVKGEKRPNQGKRGPGKITLKGRAALAAVIDGNAERLQGWLDAIVEREGPGAAWRAYVSLIEFAVPKMSRNELSAEQGPVQLVVSWLPVQEAPAAEDSSTTLESFEDETVQ